MSKESKLVFEGHVVEICDNGDAILQLPDDLLNVMGWKEGDSLSVEQDEQGRVIIKKIN